jgi:hypothetical protein
MLRSESIVAGGASIERSQAEALEDHASIVTASGD